MLIKLYVFIHLDFKFLLLSCTSLNTFIYLGCKNVFRQNKEFSLWLKWSQTGRHTTDVEGSQVGSQAKKVGNHWFES